MDYIEKKLILNKEKLDSNFIDLFKKFYGFPMHWDDLNHTRMRIADISDGSICPIDIVDNVDKYYIIALWPKKFIEDINNYPNIKGSWSQENYNIILNGLNGLIIQDF